MYKPQPIIKSTIDLIEIQLLMLFLVTLRVQMMSPLTSSFVMCSFSHCRGQCLWFIVSVTVEASVCGL